VFACFGADTFRICRQIGYASHRAREGARPYAVTRNALHKREPVGDAALGVLMSAIDTCRISQQTGRNVRPYN